MDGRTLLLMVVFVLMSASGVMAQVPLPTPGGNDGELSNDPVTTPVTPTPMATSTPLPTATLTPTITPTPTPDPLIYGSANDQETIYSYTMTAGDTMTHIMLFALLVVNVLSFVTQLMRRGGV